MHLLLALVPLGPTHLNYNNNSVEPALGPRLLTCEVDLDRVMMTVTTQRGSSRKMAAGGRRLMQPRRVITDVGGFPDFSCESVALVIILDDMCFGESWAGWGICRQLPSLMLVTSLVKSREFSRTQGIVPLSKAYGKRFKCPKKIE